VPGRAGGVRTRELSRGHDAARRGEVRGGGGCQTLPAPLASRTQSAESQIVLRWTPALPGAAPGPQRVSSCTGGVQPDPQVDWRSRASAAGWTLGGEFSKARCRPMEAAVAVVGTGVAVEEWCDALLEPSPATRRRPPRRFEPRVKKGAREYKFNARAAKKLPKSERLQGVKVFKCHSGQVRFSCPGGAKETAGDVVGCTGHPTERCRHTMTQRFRVPDRYYGTRQSGPNSAIA